LNIEFVVLHIGEDMQQLRLLSALLFVLAGTLLGAPRDYFPLQVGNEWTLENERGDVLHIEVERSRIVNGETHYLVAGYAPGEVWLKQTDAGELFVIEGSPPKEEKIAHLQFSAPPYSTKLSGCEQTAEPSAPPAIPGDPGTFKLNVIYNPNGCRDIGIVREVHAPKVGLELRSIVTFAGEQTFKLVYARVNGQVVATDGKLVLHSDFSRGSKSWLAGFSDYGLTTGDLRLLAELRGVPDELSSAREGLYLQSMNRSDDLFMFLKKNVSTADGLRPNQAYQVSFDIRFASNAPTGCSGAGGSPGESVYLKAGAVVNEPVALLGSAGDVGLNADKGQQSQSGRDATVLGNIANGQPCQGDAFPYVRVRNKYTQSHEVRTDDRGSLWLLVGTDSGFEGLTGLYYESITVKLSPL
jgi:hypothetical protein